MADPNLLTLSIRDIDALADRLMARGTSKFVTGSPELQRDMRLASRVIRVLSMNRPDLSVRVDGD